ncbi:MAG: site-2 protease family protein [Candidatus Saccharimonadales bacterium]|nr:site-2 protease family protein [Candidatus Saccharimonadales bacterium]
MEIELAGLLGISLVIATILLSMTFHEAMHAFTSHWLGDDTAYLMGRLTLNPLKHIDPILTIALPILLILAGLPPFGAAKPVPFNPYRVKYGEYGAALVGVAGPLTNLVLALVIGLWTRFVVGFDAGVLSDVLQIFVLVNLGFFVFNMIPWPPLDGSRLLYAFAPESLQDFMKSIERGGFLYIMIFMFFIYGLIAPFVARAIEGLYEVIMGIPLIL